MNRQKKSFSSFEKTLHLFPKPSKLLFIFLLLGHITAAIAILLSALPDWCTALFAGILFGSWIYSIKSAKKTQQLRLNSSGEWLIYTTEQQWLTVQLAPSTRHFSSIILLILKDKNKQYYRVLLLTDSIPADSFRQLKARLLLTQPDNDPTI